MSTTLVGEAPATLLESAYDSAGVVHSGVREVAAVRTWAKGLGMTERVLDRCLTGPYASGGTACGTGTGGIPCSDSDSAGDDAVN